MLEMIQRDKNNLLDGMLIAINANDKLNFNMQHNVIPVASAKNMGIIGMKVFADGAMYTKEPHWTRGPQEVVRTVGSNSLPSESLIHYTLTTPGVHTAIIGIGHISDNPGECQIEQNLAAAQIKPNELNETDRAEIEKKGAQVRDGKTNYFQLPFNGLTAPTKVTVSQKKSGSERLVDIAWNTAFAGDVALASYEILRDGKKIAAVDHRPQTDKTPFRFTDKPGDTTGHEYSVVITDVAGRTAKGEATRIEAI
jgi:hypothetical protein